MIQDIAPHTYDITYQKETARTTDIILNYTKAGVLCRIMKEGLFFLTAEEASGVIPDVYDKANYLFQIDDQRYYEIPGMEEREWEGYEYVPIESLRQMYPRWKVFAAITGHQIHKWYTENAFCGKCGADMQPHGRDRAMLCPACGFTAYPRISPCVIVGVIHKEELLLTRYSTTHSSFQKYGLIAGYVEIGESLEEAVRREVMEEVGLKVKNIRYYKSQPWSFSDTLLLGLFCEVEGETTVTLDEEELSEAVWFDRKNLPAERSDAELSLTGEMMEAFMGGRV